MEDGKDIKSKGASMDLVDQFLPEVDIIGNGSSYVKVCGKESGVVGAGEEGLEGLGGVLHVLESCLALSA